MSCARSVGSSMHHPVGLVVAMVLAALSACDKPQGEPPVNAPTSAPASSGVSALQQIEQTTGIRFPEGAALLQLARASDSDLLIRAKLAMTPAQWTAFLATLTLPADAFEEEKRYLLGTNDGWWNPKDPTSLPTAQLTLPDAKVLNVGVDRTDPQRLQVYFVWHGT
jgi:hypothetical protein